MLVNLCATHDKRFFGIANLGNAFRHFERIINTPTRGIGDRTLTTVRDYARSQEISLWNALNELIAQKQFTTRTASALEYFVSLMDKLSSECAAMELHKQVEFMLHASGLIDHYRKEKGEKGLTRLENVEELVNAAYQFTQEGAPDDLPPLAAFLAYAALESGDEQAETYDDGVQLMTLHSAKGLEFPIVYLPGLEQGILPHRRSYEEGRVDEERRLFYVGITRAKRIAKISFTQHRRVHALW